MESFSCLGAFHTQDGVGSNAQARERYGVTAIPAAPKILGVLGLQDVANPGQPSFGTPPLCFGHFLLAHRVDSAESALLPLVEFHNVGRICNVLYE